MASPVSFLLPHSLHSAVRLANNLEPGWPQVASQGEYDVESIPPMRNTRLSPQFLICLLLSLLIAGHAAAQAKPAAATGLAPIRQYIAAGWDNLTRSMTACDSVVDPKMKVNPVSPLRMFQDGLMQVVSSPPFD